MHSPMPILTALSPPDITSHASRLRRSISRSCEPKIPSSPEEASRRYFKNILRQDEGTNILCECCPTVYVQILIRTLAAPSGVWTGYEDVDDAGTVPRPGDGWWATGRGGDASLRRVTGCAQAPCLSKSEPPTEARNIRLSEGLTSQAADAAPGGSSNPPLTASRQHDREP